MGLRFFAFLALAGLVVFFVTRFVEKRMKKPAGRKAMTSRQTVQCAECGLYVPRSDAIEHDGHHYCSREHVPPSRDGEA